MFNTGDGSSLLAHTSASPFVVMGPTAPMDGGDYGVSMSTLGPTHSQVSRTSTLQVDLGSHETAGHGS